MGEYVITDREPTPQPPAPRLVRNWLPDAIVGWTAFMYEGRRRAWFAWGWLLLVVLVFITIKVFIYWAGLLAILAAFIVSAVYDLGTYPVRRAEARMQVSKKSE